MKNKVSVKPDREMRRDAFIREHQDEWKASGTAYANMRTRRGVTTRELAKEVGISSSTISRFECGKPVSRRKMIERSYHLGLFYIGHQRQLEVERELAGE